MLTQRVHLIWFTVAPLVASGIMYGANGKAHVIPYIDCLFMSVSAMTVTGLVTVPVSQLSLGQQIICFVLMVMGNLVVNSLVIVLVRRHMFGKKFQRVMKRSSSARKRMRDVEAQERKEHEEEKEKMLRFFGLGHEDVEERRAKPTKPPRNQKKPKLNAGMIQRINEPARQVNPNGEMTTMVAVPEPEEAPHGILQSADDEPLSQGVRIADDEPPSQGVRIADDATHGILHDGSDKASESHGIRIAEPERTDEEAQPAQATRRRSLDQDPRPRDPGHEVRRVHTVAFAEQTRDEPSEKHTPPARLAHATTMPAHQLPMRTMSYDRSTVRSDTESRAPRPGAALHRTMTRNIDKGLGGFPSPIDYAMTLLDMINARKRLTVPQTSTLAPTVPERSQSGDDGEERVRFAPYLTFDARVTGNSHFHNLTTAQRNELGGVEYRALDVLVWLIPLYWVFWVFLALVISTPYIASRSAAHYRAFLETQQDKAPHSAEWYWIFNVVSALTNTGMSLADSSFQGAMSNAYMFLIPCMILILVGNTAYPVMLRFIIWSLSKCVSINSQLYETLRFLLDHPRRCFVYLFPREHTWFLFALVLGLTIVDWFFLMILDLSRRHEAISDGTWVFDALFQSVATRSAGFQTFNILSLAPAEQMMQVFMMYLAVFPLTMTVRTTNVYEEGSLGVYDDDMGDGSGNGQGRAVWGRFLPEQVRRQVAYDLWWIALALWIVLIAEQSKLENEGQFPNLTIFTVLYEMISAYGTVGLSCGSTSDKDASLAANFTVLSKLIVCAVMIRGRHRGLPGAIDRAIMLPSELHAYDESHDVRSLEPTSTMGAMSQPGSLARTSSMRTNVSTGGLQRTASARSGSVTSPHAFPAAAAMTEEPEQLDTIPEATTPRAASVRSL